MSLGRNRWHVLDILRPPNPENYGSRLSTAARQLADRLTPAGPGHPWTGVRFTTVWGREPLEPFLVEPDLVAEISADTAVDRGVYRHPVRFVRVRLDQAPADVTPYETGPAPSP
ncbi:MAG: hypothetical protein QOF44_5331 [Streptomyces sp.]|nr:hypothetical protein [Streptomyces sp.]